MKYPTAFDRLVRCFDRFQGIGRKTSERLVFDILTRWDGPAVQEFSQALAHLSEGIVLCPSCRCHIGSLPCPFCAEDRRAAGALCIVGSSKDVYAIDSTGQCPGAFFVLGALLSPLDGRGVSSEDIEQLRARITNEKINEVILAIDSSLEGDATVGFLREELRPLKITISRLAAGVPVGISLECVDRGTLSRAFCGRQQLS